jgi:hypothetical protein
MVWQSAPNPLNPVQALQPVEVPFIGRILLSTKIVVPTIVSPDQQPQHHLRTYWKGEVLSPTLELPETLGWSMAISALTSPPGSSDACSRLEIIALDSRVLNDSQPQ